VHARDAEPVTSRRGFFWVGVERREQPHGTVAHGPMYVHWESPVESRAPYPLVLVHGGGGQGLDWLGTPDGRPGWATYLVQDGYTVYVVDRPGHGRASYHPDVLGPMGAPFTYELAMALFTATAKGPMSHPTAHLHSRWPGDGELGDPALDQFAAGCGPTLADFAAAQALEQSRGAELLDRIGPAVLMTHSFGGPAGWLMADARPDLVKAIIAIEPFGPPFVDNPTIGVSYEWGLSAAPLTYDPPASRAAELRTETHEPEQAGAPPFTLQAEPARTLPNLRSIPIAVVSSEASIFAHADGNTVAFLRQAACDAEHVRLEDRGIHGNGHLMMLEENSREVLDAILGWLDGKGVFRQPA
jgi:pimeloyl-ACP methyl ester carboxylesterase